MATAVNSSKNSRKEYLTRYLSKDSDKNKKKSKKSKQSLGKGLRLLDDDTIGRALPSASTSSKYDPELLDEEDLSESELAILLAKKNQAQSDSAFRTDTFVTVVDLDEDKSNINRVRPCNDSDKSPASRSVKRADKSDMDSDSDQEPRRRKLSPSNFDSSPPRRRKRASSSDSDHSPVRSKRRKQSSSPPPTHHHRKGGENKEANNPKIQESIKMEPKSEDEDELAQDSRKTLDGKRAGLVHKAQFTEEIEKLKKQKLTDGLDDEASGRYAETRRRATNFTHTRDKRKKSPEDEARKEREAEKQVELQEKYEKWNRGVTQIKERGDKMKEIEQTLSEGFSRYADDNAMNEHLKDQLLEEDPMASYFKLKKHKVQMRTGIVYPTYQGTWAPNRFSIQPGYRWDGVDRSNGFEGKIAVTENKRRANDELAYRTITELAE